MTISNSLTFAKVSRTALLAAAMALPAISAFSQPAAPTQMPAEVVKPMPGASTAKPGMDMKQGMTMGAGGTMGMGTGASMDMKPMMTDMHNQMMGMKSSGNVDVDFAMMMKMHHQGAITMAEAQLKDGKDKQMRAMAKDIIRAQKKEMAVFDKFLAKQGATGMKMDGSAMPMKK